MSIFSGASAPASRLLLTRGSLVIANIIDSVWFTFTYRSPLRSGSHPPQEREALAVLRAAGPSEKSHCGCLSFLRGLRFMTDIKHLVRSRIAFENYALMIATQASSIFISLWPLSGASQFGHFFNKYFLGAYHVLSKGYWNG